MHMQMGEKIRKARKDRKLTLQNLSDSVGVAVSFLSDIENGKKQPSLETLEKITAALKVPLHTLFSESVPPPLKIDAAGFSHDGFLEHARVLFMSDELSKEDKEAIFKDLTDMYWKCRGYTKE